MFIEQNNSPGQMINLDHVASMNWDNGLTTQFLMASGQTITWEYENEDDKSEDLDKLDNHLRNADKLISVELDQE